MATALGRLMEWHKIEHEALSPFGPRSKLRKEHENMRMTLAVASDHLEIVAKALNALPAYQSHDVDAFSLNHKSAVLVAKCYGEPLKK